MNRFSGKLLWIPAQKCTECILGRDGLKCILGQDGRNCILGRDANITPIPAVNARSAF